MEVHSGVFVTNVGTDDWETDPEVPGSEFHVLCSSDGVEAGLTRFLTDPGPVAWTPNVREVIHILEGSVRIEIAGGPTLELGPGDFATLAPGTNTTWHVTTPFKETWVLA